MKVASQLGRRRRSRRRKIWKTRKLSSISTSTSKSRIYFYFLHSTFLLFRTRNKRENKEEKLKSRHSRPSRQTHTTPPAQTKKTQIKISSPFLPRVSSRVADWFRAGNHVRLQTLVLLFFYAILRFFSPKRGLQFHKQQHNNTNNLLLFRFLFTEITD